MPQVIKRLPYQPNDRTLRAPPGSFLMGRACTILEWGSCQSKRNLAGKHPSFNRLLDPQPTRSVPRYPSRTIGRLRHILTFRRIDGERPDPFLVKFGKSMAVVPWA
jgi:hypothetical protein